MATKVIQVHVPEYVITSKPDYLEIGKKVDNVIEKNFADGIYGVRAIGKDDHSDLSLDQLVAKILEVGTDKYDKNRKSVCHDQFAVYDYDIQMGTFEIKHATLVNYPDELPGLFAETVYNFYEHTPLDRGYAVRIDLLLIYDLNQLVSASRVNAKDTNIKPGLENYLYKFKHSDDKKSALLGIVQILR
jgi:hypothetical protein